MFAQLHTGHPDDGMHVIGCGNGNSVQVLMLLVEHLPVVLVIPGRTEFAPDSCPPAVIDIAQHGDLCLTRTIEVIDIYFTLAANAYRPDDQLVTRRGVTRPSQYMSWNDIPSGARYQRLFDEFSAGIVCCIHAPI